MKLKHTFVGAAAMSTRLGICIAWSALGWNILAYCVYNVIGLCIPQLTVQHSTNRLFGCRLARSSLNEFKIKASKLYSDTKAKILDQIIQES